MLDAQIGRMLRIGGSRTRGCAPMNRMLPNGTLLPRRSGSFAREPHPGLRNLAFDPATRTLIAGERSMPLAKHLWISQSRSQTQVPRAGVLIRRADHDRGPQQRFSGSAIRLALARLMLDAPTSFSASSACFPMVLIAVLYWLIRKIVVSCTTGEE